MYECITICVEKNGRIVYHTTHTGSYTSVFINDKRELFLPLCEYADMCSCILGMHGYTFRDCDTCIVTANIDTPTQESIIAKPDKFEKMEWKHVEST